MKQAFVPAIDIFENGKSYNIRVELPGLKEEEVELYIDDGNLVLKGERKQESIKVAKNIIISESNYGSFYRLFPIPDNVDTEKNYSATLSKGVLAIDLPKLKIKKTKIKSIPIKVA